MGAFNQYQTETAANITVATAQGNVDVTCVINQTLFNCGFPGYNMRQDDTDTLRQWCVTNPGGRWSFGFRGVSPTHPNSVNITLIDYNQYMFNFHVYLV